MVSLLKSGPRPGAHAPVAPLAVTEQERGSANLKVGAAWPGGLVRGRSRPRAPVVLRRPQRGQAFPPDRQQAERVTDRGAAGESPGISSEEPTQVLARVARSLHHRMTFHDSTVRPQSGPAPRSGSSLLVGAASYGT
jgi:hypothetical protein